MFNANIASIIKKQQLEITYAERRENAIDHLQQFRGRIPAGLECNAELTKSRTERYAYQLTNRKIE